MKVLASFILLTIASFAWAQLPEPKNFHQVEAGIYRGARPEDPQMDFIASKQPVKNSGTLIVVDLQGGDPALFDIFEPGESAEWIAHEQQLALNEGLSFSSYPLNSAGEVTAEEVYKIDHILQMMAEALRSPDQHQIYLHCEHGVDRTGLVVALFPSEGAGMAARPGLSRVAELRPQRLG